MSRFYKFLAAFLIPFIAVGSALKDTPLPIANMGQMSFAYWQGATAATVSARSFTTTSPGGSVTTAKDGTITQNTGTPIGP